MMGALMMLLIKPPTPLTFISASGGTVTTYVLNGFTYKVHTFLSSGTFVISSLGNVDNTINYLLVAGGGGGAGGGYNNSGYSQINEGGGGGGGAGGKLSGSFIGSSTGSFAITVGGGGTGGTAGSSGAVTNGSNGGVSSSFGLTASGGGGGGDTTGSGSTKGGNGGSGIVVIRYRIA